MNIELTKAEEKVMKILWSIERGLIRDIVKQYDKPKPAYTTVATIIKILEKKGFVDRTPIANSYEYFPLIRKEEYSHGFMKSFVKSYFSNSYKRLVSELSENEELSTEEMEEIIEHLRSQIESKKKQ